MAKTHHIPYQFLTLAIGVVLLLPLQSFSLPLLLILPGLGFFLLYKGAKQIDILETIAYSLSLSLVAIPTAASIMYFASVGIAMTGAAIGLTIIAASIISFAVQKKGSKPPEVDSDKVKRNHKLVCLALPILLALSLALVVGVPLSKSLVVNDEGLVMNPTEASDLNFHLSIMARFAESPHIPPEDPYLPAHYIVYDFFTHVYVGTLSILTGISSLTIFKIAVPLLFFALSMNIYVLCQKGIQQRNGANRDDSLHARRRAGVDCNRRSKAERPVSLPYLSFYRYRRHQVRSDPAVLFAAATANICISHSCVCVHSMDNID